MTGQPLPQDGDLASICFGDAPPSPAQRRLAAAALERAAAREAAPPEDSLPPELLGAALAATSRPLVRGSAYGGSAVAMTERAAAGTVRGSRLATWVSLAAGVAGFCLVSWLIVRPSIDAGPQQASVAPPVKVAPPVSVAPPASVAPSPSVAASAPSERGPQPGAVASVTEATTDIRLVPLTPELRRGLRRFADDPGGARQDLTALLPGLADRARDIALSDRLLAIVRSDGPAPAIRAERSGPALRLQLPDEAP